MPESELAFEDAFKQLTGFELLGLQIHYGMDMERLGGLRSLMGAIWAHKNRETKTSWTVVEAMTLDEIQSYFATSGVADDSLDLNGSSSVGRLTV